MKMPAKIRKDTVLTFAALLMFTWISNGQEKNSKEGDRHVLTIFVMNSLKPIDWESPSTLVKSTTRGYMAKLFHHRQYMLGHMIARLESPLVDGINYSAMVSASMKEKRVLWMKEKIGLGILGVAMGGRLDSESDIKKDLKLFSRYGKLAYVKYHISEESARRIIEFMEGFNRSENGNLPPSSHYGGAFWPRYHQEGSGCSAYVMSIIDVAGLTGGEHENWRIDVNIPMDLVGGEINQFRKVPRKKIIKRDSWAIPGDSSIQTHIPISLFDPSIVYDWIKKVRISAEMGYGTEEENDIPGLVAIKSQVHPNPDDSVFIMRPVPSLFVDHFLGKKKN